jgi:zinc transport system ATP-binding protein
MSTLFSLKNISYSYDSTPVLSGVSVDICAHELTVITGGNGVGKTTLLKILAGILQPSRGILKKATEERYAYIAQEWCNYTTAIPVSVAEFVSSPHRIKKISHGNCWYTNLRDCLAHVGLLEHKDTPIDELSGWQQQRALIARALMTDPSVLLLDEPTAGIDMQMQNQFYELIEHFNTVHGLSTIMITHDTARQYTFWDHAIYLVHESDLWDEFLLRNKFQQKKVTFIILS